MSVTISAQAMDAALRQRLAPSRLEVIDESYQHAGHAGANDSGVGTHFRVRIAGPAFDGKTRVARHRLVYDALQDFIDQGVPAGNPAYTPPDANADVLRPGMTVIQFSNSHLVYAVTWLSLAALWAGWLIYLWRREDGRRPGAPQDI